MTTAKHTPGPWEIEGHSVERLTGRGHDVDVEFYHIAAVGYVAGGGIAMVHDKPRGVGPANAHLIAASPDLLAACKAVLARLDLEPESAIFPCSAQREMLRAAIAKAQGGAA